MLGVPRLLAVQLYILHGREDVSSRQILSAGQVLEPLDSIINAAFCTACSAMSGPFVFLVLIALGKYSCCHYAKVLLAVKGVCNLFEYKTMDLWCDAS